MIGKFYAQVRDYTAKFYHAAKVKLTTYVALATAGLTELVSKWDGAAALMPAWALAHKAEIFAVATLLPIWTRIRREISGKE